jgi:hypothetical protein
VKQVAGGIDEPAYLFLAQHDGQPAHCLWEWYVLQHIVTLERLHEEESQCCHSLDDGSGTELPLLQEITLKSPDVIWTKLIRWTVEKLGELPNCQQIRPYGSLRVITTLEFLQHHFA